MSARLDRFMELRKDEPERAAMVITGQEPVQETLMDSGHGKVMLGSLLTVSAAALLGLGAMVLGRGRIHYD